MFRRLSRKSSELSNLLASADAARDGKQWTEAAELYERFLAERPDDAGILVQAGHMRKEAGDMQAAERHYLRAKVLMPGDTDLALQLGHFYKRSDRVLEALAAYQHALELDPASEDAALELAEMRRRVRAELGAPEHPITDAQQSLRQKVAGITIDAVLATGLFDGNWYLQTYKDVARLGLDPLRHFFDNGLSEGRRPGPGFEPDWYLQAYPEVASLGITPFAHYVAAGREEGMRPAGPPMYERWIEAFDTIGPADFAKIDAHIAALKLPAPEVILYVDGDSARWLSRTVQSLRAQRLKPRSVSVCVAPGTPEEAQRRMVALFGSDRTFRVIGGSASSTGAPDVRSGSFARAPSILVSAGVDLREHALYLLALARSEGAAFAYGDEDRLDEEGQRVKPFFKPGPSPLLLRQTDYVGGCVLLPEDVVADDVVRRLAGGQSIPALEARQAFLGCGSDQIAHIPHILFHELRPGSRDLLAHLDLPAPLAETELPSVTIIIPTRDRVDLLQVCIESLLEVTDYPRALLDIVVVDNGSIDPATLDYLATAGPGRFRVLRDPSAFNYARLNNLAARASTGDVIVLLNNDTQIEDGRWLRGMVRYTALPEVGTVGPKLLYDDGTIQHAGVVLGIGVAAAHAHVGLAHDAPGTYGFAQLTREVAAVTGACLAIRRSVFEELGGLDEKLAVAFNDVDLCLSALEHGYSNVYVHDVWVRHFESKSRGFDDTPAKVDLFITEANYARRKHPQLFAADPFYSPGLSVMLESIYEPGFPPRRLLPWYENGTAGGRQSVLILASLKEPNSDIGRIVAMQASYLAERGYDVIVGTPGLFPAVPAGPQPRRAVLVDQQGAAAYAIRHRVGCVICHTSLFAGVSRLLGGHVRVVLYHHGFGAEALATGGIGREERVALRLALPAASAVLASSQVAADELEDDGVVLLPPGNDRVGVWSQGSVARRERLRAASGWSDRIVILVEEQEGKAGRKVLEVAAQLDEEAVVLVNAAAPGLPEPVRARPAMEQESDLFIAADMFWAAPDGSPLLAAEAEGHGLPVVRLSTKVDDPAEIAATIGAVAAAAGVPVTQQRQAAGRPWSRVLEEFEGFLHATPRAITTRPISTRLLLKPAMLVEASGLFDEALYYKFNPDVAAAGVDAWQHYVDHGALEGRRSSYLFDSRWYAARYPEVTAAGLWPLAHYLANPRGDYDPNPYFSNKAYLDASPDAAESKLAPLIHYVRIGAAEGRSIGDGFDAAFYAAAYSDVSPSGMSPFVHFMTVGDAEGRFPTKPVLTPVDLFDDDVLERYCARPMDEIVPPVREVVDWQSAARFCIRLLRARADLRERFPDALSSGAAGRFAAWIAGEGRQELGLSDKAAHFIQSVLAADYAARVRQAYLVRTDLQRLLPFALLPEGRGALLRWALSPAGAGEGFGIEEIWWLLLTCAEDPARQLWTTFAFTPSWQRAFPDAQTPFGIDAFRAFLKETFGLGGDYVARDIGTQLPPATAIRLAYEARPAWQAEQPDAFATRAAAERLLTWLSLPAAGLDAAQAEWLAGQDRNALATDLAARGVNMFGHFCYPSGLKTSTEALVRGCNEVGLRTSLRDIWVQEPGDEPHHVEFSGPELYDTTILLCQPEPLFDTAFVRAGVAPRARPTYRIGYWYWEQDEIPDIWIEKAARLDEVWTSTNFVGDALKKKLKVPVQVIPHGIEVPDFQRRPRSYFGLPDDQFLFLFTFHMMSVMERKNPLGLIKAFADEFSPSEKVGLVLKTSFGNHHPQQMEEMRRAAAGSNITIIDSVYTKDEVLALMDACDSYVSLHRSEGFGLTMAEAMLVGKPTIATGYSANLDFMNAENSLLVDYELVTLDTDIPPYKAGSHWAHASLRHAGECMRRVQSDPDWARELGLKAKRDLEARMSFAASGRMIEARLAEIEAMRREGRTTPRG